MSFIIILPLVVRKRCAEMELTYIESARKCHISYNYFLRIIHGRANPGLETIGKICYGLEISPDELLGVTIKTMHSYRVPMRVTKFIYLSRAATSFPVCPQCEVSLEYEYQKYCDRCGQHLSWRNYDKAVLYKKL